jgi:hypothetical protein
MRLPLLALALLSSLAIAQPTTPAAPDNFSQAKFEKRFRQADKNHDGMLSREEAYAEFPRMPEHFDEIDSNKDDRITLIEVKRALQRRRDAAMSPGGKYSVAAKPATRAPSGAAETPATPAFSSKAEARRQHRYDYYESLAASQEAARNQGEQAVPAEPYPSVLNKSF